MFGLVYKFFRKLKFFLYKKYIKSLLLFESKEARKTVKVVGDNIQVRCKNVVVGKNVTFYSGVILWGEGKIKIGCRTKIGDNTIIYSNINDEVRIGDDVNIAANCYIINMEHSIKKDMPVNLQKNISQPLEIGDDCWIATQCVVAMGAKMNSGSVLGANSYLDKELPENAVAVGSPAKIIKYRN